jgi:thiol:disulfide interchange protein DsbD
MVPAAESAAVSSPRAIVSLASDSDAVSAGQSFQLGLHFKLSPGWQIYWSNPGDAGQAPQLELQLPPGATATGIHWPAPVLRKESGVATYAYTGEVVLPVAVTLPAAGAPWRITADASWLVCADVCVPEKGRFALTLPAGAMQRSAQAPLFAAAAARWPQPSHYAASIAADGSLTLSGAGLSPQAVQRAWFFPAAWGAIDQGAEQALSVTPGRLRLALTPGQAFDAHTTLAGVLTLTDANGRERYLQIAATPAAGSASNPSTTASPAVSPTASTTASAAAATPLGRALWFALIAGLILNLMPCVFPVLAIKALSLTHLSQAGRPAARGQALAYCAGVLLAFALLGSLLLALRAAGQSAGWGFQFQSPLFVAAMAWLLFALGLNLSGVFVIGGSLMSVGDGLARRGTWTGSFFTGLLAVIVATPCTAPFMGAAIAAALTEPRSIALAIFVALGIGFASPFLLLAAVPAAARLLPKPGAWMAVLKELLAFPMYGAAAWLLWVVSQQRGAGGVLAVVIGLMLVAFAAWALGWSQRASGHGRQVAYVAALLALLALAPQLAALRGGGAPATGAGGLAGGALPAQSYSAAALLALHEQGRPVFVDMTAAWCVTCLVNERVALSSTRVRDAFAQRRVVYMKGDWTSQDPGISAFLRQFDRDGVPLYVFYPAGTASPRVLPQILTEDLVLRQLNPTGG